MLLYLSVLITIEKEVKFGALCANQYRNSYENVYNNVSPDPWSQLGDSTCRRLRDRLSYNVRVLEGELKLGALIMTE